MFVIESFQTCLAAGLQVRVRGGRAKKEKIRRSQVFKTSFAALVLLAVFITTTAQMPQQITTPDRVESRLGTLTFEDGIPDNATDQKVFDELDYVLTLYSA